MTSHRAVQGAIACIVITNCVSQCGLALGIEALIGGHSQTLLFRLHLPLGMPRTRQILGQVGTCSASP